MSRKDKKKNDNDDFDEYTADATTTEIGTTS
jgi:hypothetical protein